MQAQVHARERTEDSYHNPLYVPYSFGGGDLEKSIVNCNCTEHSCQRMSAAILNKSFCWICEAPARLLDFFYLSMTLSGGLQLFH